MYLVTADEMRRMDRTTIEAFGVPGRVLMENAGRGATAFFLKSIYGQSTGPVGVARRTRQQWRGRIRDGPLSFPERHPGNGLFVFPERPHPRGCRSQFEAAGRHGRSGGRNRRRGRFRITEIAHGAPAFLDRRHFGHRPVFRCPRPFQVRHRLYQRPEAAGLFRGYPLGTQRRHRSSLRGMHPC